MITQLIPPETLPSLPDDPFGTHVLTDPYEFHYQLREAGRRMSQVWWNLGGDPG